MAFCETVGLDYVSCSPYRVPIARLAAAQAALAGQAGALSGPLLPELRAGRQGGAGAGAGRGSRRRRDDEATLALLDAAWAAPRAAVIGLTGPPGVGKSTLVSALVRGLARAAAARSA